jgi:hypothetical protein
MKRLLIHAKKNMSILPHAVLLLSLATQSFAVDVLVRATAREDYIREYDANDKPLFETYTFFEGNYHPAEYEEDEEAIIFEEVAFALKQELLKNNYVMAEDPMDAQFILVTHWGQTNSAPDEQTFDFIEDGDLDSPFEYSSSMESDIRQRENAKIIGATSLYDMHVYSLKRKQLEEAAINDRYFVNVIALSIDEIRTRPEHKRMPKPLWTLQLSLPAGRFGPEEAFVTLAQTAGRFSGENLLHTDFIREEEKKGMVRIGELEFIETLPTENKAN